MEERKWEDMNSDCLVNILGRLDLQSKVLVIPLVCKPWYQAVRNPLCWKQISFPSLIFGPRSQTELIKFVVALSQRCATYLSLPYECNAEDLIYVSEECPSLNMLVLPDGVCMEHKDIIPNLIVKWKNLELLVLLGCITCIKEILELIHIHLPNFSGLGLDYVDGETAFAIVSLVPRLKYLVIYEAYLKKEDLLLILQGCKELVFLDVQNCIGFDENDDDILRLSSGIKIFRSDGSIAMEPSKFTDPDPDPDTVDDDIANIDFNIFEEIEGDEQ